MNEIKDDFGNWFAGFTDGEGYFAIRKQNRENPYSCQFKISLRDDDRLILEEVRDVLGIGFTYNEIARPSDGRNNQAVTRFQVCSMQRTGKTF